MRSLSVAEQQMVEISKALTMNAQLIIMDEPTAALSGREVDKLHEIIRDLKAKGISIIYVSHKLNEVKAVWIAIPCSATANTSPAAVSPMSR